LVNLSDLNATRLLDMPPDFDVWHHNFVRGEDSTSWSSDGRFLLIADQNGGKTRLWCISVESGEWELVLPELFNPESGTLYQHPYVSWSSDDLWVAWWTYGVHGFDIVFLSTKTWEVVRKVTISLDWWGEILGWVTTTSGDPYLVVWSDVPGEGLHLLHPEDGAQDHILIDYDSLIARFNITEDDKYVKRLYLGPWQP
jgi:hypothetical protein